MVGDSFTNRMIEAADNIGDVPLHELQILIRRAAIRLLNVEGVMFDEDAVQLLDEIADEQEISRSELVRLIVRDWLVLKGYLLDQNPDARPLT